MKKRTAIVLVLFLCLSLCGCGDGNVAAVEEAVTEPSAAEVPVETIRETQPEPTVEVRALAASEDKPDFESIYEEVLEQYRQALLMDSGEYSKLHTNSTEREWQLQGIIDSSETEDTKLEKLQEWLELPTFETDFPYINLDMLWRIHMAREEGELYGKYHDLYYAYYDVDGNELPELLIGDCTDSRENIIGLYTIRSQAPYTLECSTGYRSYLSIYKDGTISVDSSGGASLHSWSFYRINKEWNMLDMVSHYYVNYDYPESETVRQDLEEYMATLMPVTEFDWMPLFPNQ